MAQWVSLNSEQYKGLINIFNPSTSGGNLIDCSNFINNYQTDMQVISSSDAVQYEWLGGNALGCSSVLPMPITNAKYIKGSVTTGISYTTSEQHLLLSIGVRTTLNTTDIIFTPLQVSDFLEIQTINSQNITIPINLDLSNITDTVYLYIMAHGWNAIFTDLEIIYTDETRLNLLDVLNSIDTDLKDIANAIRGN